MTRALFRSQPGSILPKLFLLRSASREAWGLQRLGRKHLVWIGSMGLSVLGCSPQEGEEGGPCFRNGTCNDDWVCLSDFCVADPDAVGSSTGGVDSTDETSGSGGRDAVDGSGGDGGQSTGGAVNDTGGAPSTGGTSTGGSGGSSSGGTGGGSSSGGTGGSSSGGTGGSSSGGTGGSLGPNLIENNTFANDGEGWTSSPQTQSITTSVSEGNYCIYNPHAATESVHFQYPDNVSNFFSLKMGGSYQLSFRATGFADGQVKVDDYVFPFSIEDGSEATTVTEEFISSAFVSGAALVFNFDIPGTEGGIEYGICFQVVNLHEKQ